MMHITTFLAFFAAKCVILLPERSSAITMRDYRIGGT